MFEYTVIDYFIGVFLFFSGVILGYIYRVLQVKIEYERAERGLRALITDSSDVAQLAEKEFGENTEIVREP